MSNVSFTNTIGNFRRFRTVVGVLFDEGLSWFVDDLRLRYALPFSSRMRGVIGALARRSGRAFGSPEEDAVPLAVRFRRACERLGPTFIKLGQLMSLREDVLPPEFIAEFAKLQDSVKTLAPGVAEKVVERELKQPIENLFRSFEEKPLAAASLAQVHRAVLKDGTVVAVKVRRPGIERVMADDVRIFTLFARLLERHVPEARKYRPTRIAAEFADWTLRELDFEAEGAYTERFRENFAGDTAAVVPRVHWGHTTKAVLVTDLIDGIRIDDVDALRRAKIDRVAVARAGLRIGFTQFFLHGFFHGDPHPGNFVVVRPPRAAKGADAPPEVRIGMYDFGIVGLLTDRHRYELVSCFQSFVNRDIDGYLRHVLDLAESGEGGDIESFSRETRAILVDVLHKPSARKGVGAAFYRVTLLGARYGVLFPTDLVLLGKALVTLETIGMRLYPEIDLHEELRPFLADVVRREFSPSTLARQAKADAFDTLYFLKHLPDQTKALFDRLEKGEIGVKINLQELQDLKAEFDRQNDVRVLSILAVALLVASAIVLRLDERAASGGISVGQMAMLGAVIVTVWLVLLIRRRPNL